MEIEINKIGTLGEYDDGCREISAKISVADNVSLRRQRQAIIYEVLAVLLGYSISHNQLTNIADILGDALDQLDSINTENKKGPTNIPNWR